MGQGHEASTTDFYSPSLPKFTAGACLLEPAVVRRLDSISFSAASAASIHSEYMSIGSVRSAGASQFSEVWPLSTTHG